MTYRPKLRILLGGSLVFVAALPVAALAGPFRRDAGSDVSPLAQPTEKVPIAPRAPAPDQATVQKLHDANQMEIQMGSLAKDRGSTKSVREFGRQLIADHTAADRRLDDYLRRHGSDLKTLATTTGADPDHELLATKTGTQFDRAFGLQMIADHTKAIELVESARIETGDGQLRDLYELLLPTLQAHKKAAQEIVAASVRS